MVTYLERSNAELWLDDLLLTGETFLDDGSRFTLKAQADADWGNPEPVDVEVARWMTDGPVASNQGYGNREPVFYVKMSADTSADLAAAERALVSAARNAETLRWIPPEGDPDAPTSVFEMWTCHLSHQFRLDDEHRLARMWQVSCRAKPWVRAAEPTTVAAITTSATPTLTPIDTCSSATGWTGFPNTTPTVVGGELRESGTVTVTKWPVTVSRTLVRSGSVTGLAGKPYLVLDVSVTGGVPGGYIVTLGTSTSTVTPPLPLVAVIGSSHYYAFPTGTTSFTSLNIGVYISATATGTVQLRLNDVSASNAVGTIGSAKQLTRSLAVGGAVPTAGSIHLAASSGVLGTCLVYTCSDDGSGFTPPMRQYRTAGNTVAADTTAVSGFHEPLVTNGASAGVITFTIAAGLLKTATYAVIGRFIFGAAATLNIIVDATLGGTTQEITGTVTRPNTAGATWGVIGALTLPPAAVPDESAVATVVTINATADTGTHTLDELYLCDVTNGAVSLVTATSYSQLWLDAPDVNPNRNVPAVYGGTLADRSDAVTPPYTQILSLGKHELDPDGSRILTVTGLADNAAMTATFYRRGHTHPPVDN